MIFFFLVVLDSLYGLSFLTRGLTCAMTVKVPSPDHWVTREFLIHDFKSSLSKELTHWKRLMLGGIGCVYMCIFAVMIENTI